MKKYLIALVLTSISSSAFAFSDCAGTVRLDDQKGVVQDFVISARDAVFGMSYVSIMKMFGGAQLEALRYENCKSPWPEGSRVETICELPKLESEGYEHFPIYLGMVREGDRTKPGRAEVYFLNASTLSGARPIGSIYCEPF